MDNNMSSSNYAITITITNLNDLRNIEAFDTYEKQNSKRVQSTFKLKKGGKRGIRRLTINSTHHCRSAVHRHS